MRPSPLPLPEAIERYLHFLQAEENKSPLTVSNYHQSLNLLVSLTSIKTVNEFSKESISNYKQALHSARTRQGGSLSEIGRASCRERV